MTLNQRFQQRWQAVAEAWLAKMLAALPESSRRFIATESDPFANPAGATLRRETRRICEGLARGDPPELSDGAMHEIIESRCLQGASAGETVSFVFLLKEILRTELRLPAATHEAWCELDRRVDALALAAFDAYANCRERLYNLRVNELKRSVYSLRRASQLHAPPSHGSAESGHSADRRGNCP